MVLAKQRNQDRNRYTNTWKILSLTTQMHLRCINYIFKNEPNKTTDLKLVYFIGEKGSAV